MTSLRSVEAIVAWNQRYTSGEAAESEPRLNELKGAFRLIALTCIDPRLNTHLPRVLGLHAEQFIWLRNAGKSSPLAV
jgi:carbonic anhydrase